MPAITSALVNAVAYWHIRSVDNITRSNSSRKQRASTGYKHTPQSATSPCLFHKRHTQTRPLPKLFRCLNDFSMPDDSSCALAPPAVACRLVLKLLSPFLEDVPPPPTPGAQLECIEDRLTSFGAINDADMIHVAAASLVKKNSQLKYYIINCNYNNNCLKIN